MHYKFLYNFYKKYFRKAINELIMSIINLNYLKKIKKIKVVSSKLSVLLENI